MKFCGREFFSSSKIACLANDIRGGGGPHGAALCGLSVRGGQKIPWGQFHSNTEVFKTQFVAATRNFDGRPLPPSVGRRYYGPN